MVSSGDGATPPNGTPPRRAPKALVLVGGYGTRLRPLTLTVPKPIVDFGASRALRSSLWAWERRAGKRRAPSALLPPLGAVLGVSIPPAIPPPLRRRASLLTTLHRRSAHTLLSTPPTTLPGNKPMICHQIEALKEAGCDEVVLAINYRPQVMMDFLKEWEVKLGIKITCSQEPEPMGTAGPLALARAILDDGSGTPFFVLNSDVICEYPLRELLAFHEARGAEVSILVTKVKDPSKYGVVLYAEDGKVDRFVEKPKDFVGDRINAGIYCCSPAVLDRIEARPTSIEKEVFPAVAAEGKLFSMELEGYWMDVGQPKDYLTGLALHLGSLRRKKPAELAEGEGIEGDVIIDASAKIGAGCRIGPNVAIGIGCEVGDGVRLSNCVLLHRVKVKAHARIVDSIVGWGTSVGRWARVDSRAVIGEDVFIQDEVYLCGAIVLPHKDIKESVLEPGTIIM